MSEELKQKEFELYLAIQYVHEAAVSFREIAAEELEETELFNLKSYYLACLVDLLHEKLRDEDEIIKKDSPSQEKGNMSKALRLEEAQEHLQLLNGIYDMNRCQQFGLFRKYHSGIAELSRIFGVLQSEEAARFGDSTISFEHVETEIAKYISKCLSDIPSRKRNTNRILSLLKENKLVQPLQDGTPSVSLLTLCSILQDNFQGSCLCSLINVFVAETMGVRSKMITF